MQVLDKIRAELLEQGDEIIGTNNAPQLITAINRISIPGVGTESIEITSTDPNLPVRRFRPYDDVAISAFSKIGSL